MSREDKARHTLHQTLIIDGFCRAGLALGSPPPSCLQLSVCVPLLATPSKADRRAGRLSYLHWVFFFSGVCIFFLFYCIVEWTIASSSEGGKATPSRELTNGLREDAEAEGVF